MLHLLIQHVETIWTKKSRGCKAARERNAVPEAVLVPERRNDSEFILHHATFSEATEFSLRDEMKISATFDGLRLRFLSSSMNDDGLAIRFHRDGCNAAVPSPYPYKNTFTLHHEELGRIVYNGRYTDWSTGNWWYEKHVYNIGWLREWNVDVFVQNQRRREFREMAKLR